MFCQIFTVFDCLIAFAALVFLRTVSVIRLLLVLLCDVL